jgi:TPR repeat protein
MDVRVIGETSQANAANSINAKGNDMVIASCLAAAAAGDLSAYFDLGVAFSTGNQGAQSDLVEAHKWFNIAAARGHEEAAWCRADISEEMTAREIAEAQRRAREWLAATARKAA